MCFFAQLFGVYHSLRLVFNNSIQQVICETNSLKSSTFFNTQITRISVYMLLSCWSWFFGFKLHIPNICFRLVLREENCWADFLAKRTRWAANKDCSYLFVILKNSMPTLNVVLLIILFIFWWNNFSLGYTYLIVEIRITSVSFPY